jgi:hypothetical protein
MKYAWIENDKIRDVAHSNPTQKSTIPMLPSSTTHKCLMMPSMVMVG